MAKVELCCLQLMAAHVVCASPGQTVLLFSLLKI